MYEKRIQTSVDNTVNDLRYEIKFENCLNDKNDFFIQQNISFLFLKNTYFISGGVFFKIPKNLIASALFLPRQILKKHAEANFERCTNKNPKFTKPAITRTGICC